MMNKHYNNVRQKVDRRARQVKTETRKRTSKCWRSKFTTSSRCIEVDGCTDSTVIVDNFSNYFKKIYACNDQTRADKLKAAVYKLRNGYCGLPVPCNLDFDTELVCKALTKL